MQSFIPGAHLVQILEGGGWGSGGDESASPPGYKTAKLPGLGKVKKL